MTPRRRVRRGAIIGIVAAVLAVLAGGIAVALWLNTADSAEAGAQRYLDALASGDPDRVVTTLTADTAPEAATLRAFAAASAYPSQPEVAGAETSGDDTVIVSAGYFLPGGFHAVTFTMRQQDGRWLADADALGSITATTPIGDAVQVGDVVIDASSSFVALPAAYDVAAAPAGILEGSAQIVVAPGATTEVAIDVSFAPDAAQRAQPSVDAYLETCTRSTTAAPAPTSPASCGISIPWGAELASADGFAFRVEAFPTVAIKPDGGFIATGGSYVVTVSGVTRKGERADVTYRDDAWTLRGALAFEAGTLVLQAF